MLSRLREEINRIFVGKEEVVEDLLICLLAGGHVLLEDVPGVGKTTLARTLAKTAALSFGRIQFTPDTLPGDVVGVSVYNMKTGEFAYREGIVMHQILLADEINRTSPKTQASLLEAMAEGRVTVDGKTYELPQPFLVIATQNPIEFLGTYPLPEAELDRFMMRLSIGYPGEEEEIRLARSYAEGVLQREPKIVLTAEELLSLQRETEEVFLSDAVLRYIRGIVQMTREEKRFLLGGSPRAMLQLLAASRAKAFLAGKSYVSPDEVKAVAEKVLLHRLSLSAEARLSGEEPGEILRSLIRKVRVPAGDLK